MNSPIKELSGTTCNYKEIIQLSRNQEIRFLLDQNKEYEELIKKLTQQLDAS